MQNIPRRLLSYFLQGILFTFPLAVTGWVLVATFRWADSVFFQLKYPGLGILSLVILMVLVGFMGSTFIASWLFRLLESILVKLPLVNIIYTSIKDLIGAFIGDQKKFNQAVLVTINIESDLKKIGFITTADLAVLGLENQVAVYLPHSYNFSGDLYILPASQVVKLNIAAADAMKFTVSGGVAGLSQNH